MKLDPLISEHFPGLNDAQREVVGHKDGPLLVIAGPGSGKTFSLVLRTLNLLMLGRASPKKSYCALSRRKLPSSCAIVSPLPPGPWAMPPI